MNFKAYCEQIFEKWMAGSFPGEEFAGDFQTDHIPEPYYTLKEGKKILYVLNYNPGQGLPVQTMDEIRKHGHDNFCMVSRRLSQWYKDNLMNPAERNARSRNRKILDLAKLLGFDGVECLETFYLHSRQFNRTRFMKRYKDHADVQEYTRLLSDYLKDKPVLAISAVRSDLELETLKDGVDDWVNYRCRIINLDLKESGFMSCTEKNGKPSSGFFFGKNRKIFSVMKGSNNLPNTDSVMEQKIVDRFNGKE